METSNNFKPQTRAIPRENSKLLIAAAVLLLISGAATIALGQTYHFNALFPLWPSIAAVLAGVLLIASRKLTGLFMLFAIVLAAAMTLYSGSSFGWLAVIAALPVLLSTVGWRSGSPSASSPSPSRRSILNLAAAALALICLVLTAMETAGDYARLLGIAAPIDIVFHIVSLLPLISVILLPFSVERQRISESKNHFPSSPDTIPLQGGVAAKRTGWFPAAANSFQSEAASGLGVVASEKKQGIFAGLIQQLYGNAGGSSNSLLKWVGVIFMVLACLSIIAVVLGLIGVIYAFIAGAYMRDFVSAIEAGGIGFISSLVLAMAVFIMSSIGKAPTGAFLSPESAGVYYDSVSMEYNPDELPEL